MSGKRLLPATFLLAGAGLLFELALTRLLSYVFQPGFTFLVLSLALAGLGLGAAAAALSSRLRSEHLLGLHALAAGVTMLYALAGFSAADSSGWLYPLLLLSMLPFVFSGLAFSTLFSLHAADSHRLYWADLLGAGSGALLAVPILNALGAPGAVLLAALLAAAAGLLWPARARRSAVASALFAVAVLVPVFSAQPGLVPADRNLSTKPLQVELAQGARLLDSRSDAFGRSDLVVRPDGQAHYLYLDGGAGSYVPLSDSAQLKTDPGWLPFAAFRPDSVFIIGPGGGLDTALARLAAPQRIVAAELNRAGVQLAQQVNENAWSETELHTADGRTVLRRTAGRFDLIFLSHVLSDTGEARGFALSEAGSYTVEAFREYVQHLEADGVIALKLYDEASLSRAFFTAYEALAVEGAERPADHLLALLDPSGSRPLPLLLVRREAFPQAEAVRVARQAEELGLAFLFVPHLLADPPLDGLADGSSTPGAIIGEAAADGINLAPVRDDAPYFFQFGRGVPAALVPAVWLAALLLILSLPLFRRGAGNTGAPPLLFAALGAGFLALELGFLQKIQLFLGQPTAALSLVLGVLLLAGGSGSLLAGRLQEPLRWAPLLTAVLAGVWLLTWPLLTATFGASPEPLRLLVAALSLVPSGAVLGMMLPAALRRLSGSPRDVAAAWAINGLCSVSGSVAAALLAVLAGYTYVLLLGCACYLLVFVAARSRAETPAEYSRYEREYRHR
ncbi:MAG TPA: hypothetical protein VK092_09565 [Deinococcales bacterium]|nr:hypothetical protein [Deinococcales bacterium]